MATLTDVRQALLTRLNTMSTLKAVFNYETSNPDGKYPFATLTLREGDGEFRSTAHNLRRRGFSLKVYQEQSKVGQGPQNAEEISVAVLDELEALLDMDTTLGGVCKYVIPARWDAGYVDRELDTRILEVEIDAYDIVASA